MVKCFDKIMNSMLEEDESARKEIKRPHKPFPWVKVVKVVLLCSSLGICLFALRTAPLEVFPGEELGTHSSCLEPGCLPAVYVMFLLTILHSVFPVVFRWKKTYQKLLWICTLPLCMVLFMPKILAHEAELAAYLFCREFGLESTVFHFFSSLYDFNTWYVETLGVVMGMELILYVIYFIIETKKEV